LLSKKQRLTKSSAFQATYRLRQSTADALLVLYVGKEKAPSKLSKIGFIVSKKIHKRSVKRNRIKRLTREAYKVALQKNEISPPWVSVIFTARNAALDADFKQVYNSVVTLINKMDAKLQNEKIRTKTN